MSFAVCLTQLEEAGTIDAERAARFRREYDRLTAAYGKTMGKVDAEMQAGRDALDALEYGANIDAVQKLKQINVQRDLLMRFAEHLARGGKAGHFLANVMDHHEGAVGSSVANRHVAIRNTAWSMMGDFALRYKRNLLGVVGRAAELDDVARALRGEPVENGNAKLVADAVSQTFEWLRREFNRAGGAIAKLKEWGMPQSHDAQLIARVGLTRWKDFIRPRLDPAKMIDATTGKPFADDGALEEALDAAWRNITSEGMDGAIPGAFTGQGKVANRRGDHRFLIFRDTDAWLEYHAEFGSGSIFDVIAGHIDGMARDIAAMQVLGPNPALTIRWLKDVAAQDALPTMAGGQAIKLEKDARKGAALMERMWRQYSGELTHTDARATARFFSGVRNLNVASKLGSAFVSAFFTDPGAALTAARFNGLSQWKMASAYLQTFNPLQKSHREAAAHAGLVLDEMTQRTERMWRSQSAMRFNIHELTRRLADGVLRGTLLSPSTVAWRQAIGLSFMKEWGELAGRGWGDLGDGHRMAFERAGIDAADWDRLRAVGADKSDGVPMLRPGDLVRADSSAEAMTSALKFFELIDMETMRGNIGGGLRVRTAANTLGGALELKRGNVLAELIHSGTQFKSFGIAAVLNMWTRTMFGRGDISGAQYFLRTVTLMTLGGMLAEQMIQIRDGKDPLPFDEALLGRGFVRGGGGGLLGDILHQGWSNDRGNTLMGFATGPTVGGFLDPLIGLTMTNAGQAARDKETNVGRESWRFLKSAVPGSNAWYGKLALQRMLLDDLDELIDPDVGQARRRQWRTAADQGSDFWWAPGEDSPDRAPDLMNMFAEAEE